MRRSMVHDETGKVSRCQTVQGSQARVRGLDSKSRKFCKIS